MSRDLHRPPRPGAHTEAGGVRFTVRSRVAEGVELCLFDAAGDEERRAMEATGDGLWSCRVAGAGVGQRYGYRVHGPWRPLRGERCNPAKLVVDPWARAVSGELRWSEALRDHARGHPERRSRRDSAPWVPRAVVVDPAFDWGDDRRPCTPWEESVIYECHVKGLTRLHPEVPEALRGTWGALAAEPVVDHLKRLGVTAVELLPVAHPGPEEHLLRRGMVNYWGYSPLAFFAPHSGYAREGAEGTVREFKRMVRDLHAAGLEVILDVVLNHTCEGDLSGPALTLRPLDHAAYYRLRPADRRRYVDTTGCGNSLDLDSPDALELVVTCLRHWAEEMRVDGFRFDLAPTLGRTAGGFDPAAPFFRRLAAEPALEGLKLIAEPWDVGPGGYRLGRFPAPWREWNDRFRRAARGFWAAEPGALPELSARLAGSHDLFPAARGGPSASIDYVTAHDGFTLADLVSYERKHNEANREGDRDGSDHERSRNWGVEGPTDDGEVLARRRRARRSLLATLLLATGTPMISHGDELGRTQEGNNNPYCHDSPLTWVDWELDAEARGDLDFARLLARLRRSHHPFRDPDGSVRLDGHWLHPEGRAMRRQEWEDPHLHALAWHREDRLLLLDGSVGGVRFRLPPPPAGTAWRPLLDSAAEATELPGPSLGDTVDTGGSRLLLLAAEPVGE